MSLLSPNQNIELKIAGKTFWVPIINSDVQTTVKKTDKDWLEEIEKKNEKANAKIECCNDSDSESYSDDDLFDHWINEGTKVEEEQPMIANLDQLPPPPIEVGFHEIDEQLDTEQEQYTHFIHFPVYECDRFERKVAELEDKIKQTDGSISEYFKIGKHHLIILPLNLSDFQLDIVNQILENFFEANPECKSDSKAKARRIRLDAQGIRFFGNGSDAKQARVLYADIRKDAEALRMDKIIHCLISQFIELGIVNEIKLTHARFDLSQMMYKLEQPHITIAKKKAGVFDVSKIVKEFGDFYFGDVVIEKIMLSKMDKEYTNVKSISLQ